jgi:hypothetical protein
MSISTFAYVVIGTPKKLREGVLAALEVLLGDFIDNNPASGVNTQLASAFPPKSKEIV